MRQIHPHPLWVGNAGDLRNPAILEATGIAAVVDLALAERPLSLSREVIYCRIPLVDGGGNSQASIALAIATTAALVRSATATLVFCGAGMSRSPCIAAAALATTLGADPDAQLRQVVADAPADVSPLLWAECKRSLQALA